MWGLWIAATSLRTGLAVTLLLQGVRWAAGHMGPALHYSCFVGQGPCALPGMRGKTGRADVGIGPYEIACRGGRPCPPDAVCYLGVRRGGALPLPRATARVAPTEAQQEVQWAGDRKGRPCGAVTRGAVRRADVGSELSAASGRGSEVSEWPRSKFPASAVRQRRNFGHRNRIIGPYGWIFWGISLHHFAEEGPGVAVGDLYVAVLAQGGFVAHQMHQTASGGAAGEGPAGIVRFTVH